MTIDDVAGAQSLGIDPLKLDTLLARCRKDVDSGLLPSCQVALARDGAGAATSADSTVIVRSSSLAGSGAAFGPASKAAAA